jgi:hypothetical protein
MLLACVVLTVWYAWPQILYSLHFLYSLGRFFLPGVVPEVARPEV